MTITFTISLPVLLLLIYVLINIGSVIYWTITEAKINFLALSLLSLFGSFFVMIGLSWTISEITSKLLRKISIVDYWCSYLYFVTLHRWHPVSGESFQLLEEYWGGMPKEGTRDHKLYLKIKQVNKLPS